MNAPHHPDHAMLNTCVFRSADRMRIDACAKALTQEGLSLALDCPLEALLDHYLNLLLRRIAQQAPEHRLEVYFPSSTDALLSRFNEALAHQSLPQAVQARASAHQSQIWLVHDAQSLPESELQLLARLIQNFPGANIRAILLLSGKATAQKSPLSAFGRKILRWDIEAPTEAQTQACLEQARQDGHFNAVQDLVQRMQHQQGQHMLAHAPTHLSAHTPAHLHAPDLSAAAPAPSLADLAAARSSTAKKPWTAWPRQGALAMPSWSSTGARLQGAGRWLGQNHKLALGLGAALLMSTLMMLWVQPQAFGLKAAQAVPAPTLNRPPLVTPSPSPAAATPSEAAIEPPESTLQGQAWLMKLDANSFLLQHSSASSYAAVLAIQRQHPLLQNAQIIAAYRPGEKLAHFVIVSGPYSSWTQGHEAAQQTGMARSWVRPTRGLQEQLKIPS